MRCYVADGEAVQQAFEKFSEAQKSAIQAPWANGMVYRHACDYAAPIEFASAGKLVFKAPGAPFDFPERGGVFPELEH